MKTIFTFACLYFLVLFTVNAQSIDLSGQAAAVNQNAVTTECNQLKQILKLDDEQYQKIVSIKSEWQKNLEVVNMLYPEGADAREEKIKELEVQYDGEFAAVLTDHQFDQYLIKMGRPRNEETANWFLEMEALAAKKKKAEGPDFNDKVQQLLKEATRAKPDSVQLAMQRKHDEYNSTALEELGALDAALLSGSPSIAFSTTPELPATIAPVADTSLVLPEMKNSQTDQISLMNSGDLELPQQAGSAPTLKSEDPEIFPAGLEPAKDPTGTLNQEKSVASEPQTISEPEPLLPETPDLNTEKIADLPEGH